MERPEYNHIGIWLSEKCLKLSKRTFGSMKDRIYWIDYLKAFTMFLVVLGHSGLDNDSIIKSWIYGFHMPLFIFVSGYFVKKSRPILVELKNDIRNLCVPYLFFSVFLIPFFYFIQEITGGLNVDNPLLYIGKRLLMDDYYHCGPIWFLGALLVIKTICNAGLGIIEKGLRDIFVIKSNICIIVSIIVLFVCGNIFDLHVLSATSAFALLPYYITGALCPKLINKIESESCFVYALIGLVIYSTISMFNMGIDYDQLKFGCNIFVTYIEGFLGCFSITLLFSCFSMYKIEILVDMGMNTLTILGFHSIFIQIFRFIYKRSVLEAIPLWYLFAISIVSFMACYGISQLIMRICPQVIGRK